MPASGSRLPSELDRRRVLVRLGELDDLRATREAEALHQEYFKGRKFTGYPYPFPAYAQPKSGQANHDFCRDP